MLMWHVKIARHINAIGLDQIPVFSHKGKVIEAVGMMLVIFVVQEKLMVVQIIL